MPTPLISATDLAHGTEVTVLDVRYQLGGPGGRAEFETGHIAGAAYVDMDTELAAPPGLGGRHPLPDPQVFAAAMRRAGVSADRPVVVYDAWLGLAAGRAWWLLRYHGHLDVRLLDGGWPAWLAAGGPVETGPESTRPPGDFVPRPGGMPLVRSEEVPGVAVLIDARAPERYRGEAEPVDPVAGHIPGAVNLPTAGNLDSTGRFLPADQLRERYAAVGAVPGADVAVYCGSGVTAVHDIVAMELAGVTAALYPDSWSGWVTDPHRPVARGQ